MCRGDGRIVEWLEKKNITTSYSEIREDKDFFDWDDNVDLIFTNPPFSLAQEFIDHSVARARTTFMLLRINFLGSIKRHDWWVNQPPTSLYVFSKRPSFTGAGTDATDYAWFVWDKTDRIPHGIHFVQPPSKEQASRDNTLAKKALGSL